MRLDGRGKESGIRKVRLAGYEGEGQAGPAYRLLITRTKPLSVGALRQSEGFMKKKEKKKVVCFRENIKGRRLAAGRGREGV